MIASGTGDAEQFVALLGALGFSVIPKGDAEHLERVRRKTGGKHPNAPGNWQVNSTNSGWVSFLAGFSQGPGMFCPAEAREIAMALILMAEQEERRRT